MGAGSAADPYTGQNTYNGFDYGPVPNNGGGFLGSCGNLGPELTDIGAGATVAAQPRAEFVVIAAHDLVLVSGWWDGRMLEREVDEVEAGHEASEASTDQRLPFVGRRRHLFQGRGGDLCLARHPRRSRRYAQRIRRRTGRARRAVGGFQTHALRRQRDILKKACSILSAEVQPNDLR